MNLFDKVKYELFDLVVLGNINPKKLLKQYSYLTEKRIKSIVYKDSKVTEEQFNKWYKGE
jgi:hypothetical protein